MIRGTSNQQEKVGNWIIVERLPNWKIDYSEGFIRFGLPARTVKLAMTIHPGDRLFTYVSSGISSFSDMREVVNGGFRPLQYGGNYDTAYPIAISTRPIIVLEKSRWIRLERLKDSLSFCIGRDPKRLFRTSIKKISSVDADIIMNALTRPPAKN